MRIAISGDEKSGLSRPTVSISRRRESEAAEREGASACFRAEDRPDYAGRLHALLGRLLCGASQ
jgi:hypothetical protein